MTMRLRWTIVALTIALMPAAVHAQASGAAATAAGTITADEMKARITFLASDELQGRDTPSPGLTKAAEYIANEFKSFGLQPMGDNGTFIQNWPYRRTALNRQGIALRATRPDGAKDYAYGNEFFLVPAGTDSAVAAVSYAGLAKDASNLGDVRGKAAMFYITGQPSAEWQQLAVGALQAGMRSGASMIVLAMDESLPAQVIAFVAQQVAGAALPPGAPPVVGIRYDLAKELAKAGGVDFDSIRDRNALTPLNGVTLALRSPVERTETPVPNVVGVLPGSDPGLKDEYVVFSAHMDHVGVGQADETGDSIFNGADDDASGTSVILEVAQAFASLKERPKRSLIFLTVSGEEKGLLGSAHFTEHPPVPVKQMVANINVDMIGRNNPDSVVAIGQDYSSIGPTLQAVAKAQTDLHLTVAPDLWPEERLFFRSDHFNFARNDVAAIFFTTGLHADYHKQSDEVETIDTDKAARVAKLVFHLGNELANAASAPKWTEQGIKEVKAMAPR
jgi:hypothetical protein